MSEDSQEQSSFLKGVRRGVGIFVCGIDEKILSVSHTVFYVGRISTYAAIGSLGDSFFLGMILLGFFDTLLTYFTAKKLWELAAVKMFERHVEDLCSQYR